MLKFTEKLVRLKKFSLPQVTTICLKSTQNSNINKNKNCSQKRKVVFMLQQRASCTTTEKAELLVVASLYVVIKS